MNNSSITYFHTCYNKLQSITQDNYGKKCVKVNYSKTVQHSTMEMCTQVLKPVVRDTEDALI